MLKLELIQTNVALIWSLTAGLFWRAGSPRAAKVCEKHCSGRMRPEPNINTVNLGEINFFFFLIADALFLIVGSKASFKPTSETGFFMQPQ